MIIIMPMMSFIILIIRMDCIYLMGGFHVLDVGFPDSQNPKFPNSQNLGI